MKYFDGSYMHPRAILLVALALVLPSGFLGAKDRDYRLKINTLFEQAASCEIKGEYSLADVECEVDFIARTGEQLNRVKKCFLDVKAKFWGLDDFDRPPSMHTCLLELTWKDAKKNEVAQMSLLDGHTLIFSDKTIYETEDVTLLVTLVLMTNPEAFSKPQALPGKDNDVKTKAK